MKKIIYVCDKHINPRTVELREFSTDLQVREFVEKDCIQNENKVRKILDRLGWEKKRKDGISYLSYPLPNYTIYFSFHGSRPSSDILNAIYDLHLPDREGKAILKDLKFALEKI